MAVIIIRVGTEEKEISGLTRRTTCAEVLEALFKDEQTFCSLNQTNEDLNSKNVNELMKNFVIMENWRGCEKALSAQTRILAVWKAWGEEQRNVKFTLKKDKGMQFNQAIVKNGDCDCDCGKNRGQQAQTGCKSTQFLSKLTAEQKKRIRRNMMQYQQAILNQQTRLGTDNNNNAGVQFKYNQSKRNSKLLLTQPSMHGANKITLSEEQFVDEVIGFVQYGMANDIAQNNLEKKLYREHCNYRRPHHRHHLPNGLEYHLDYQTHTPPINRPKLQYPHRNKPTRRSGTERKNYGSRKDESRAPKTASRRRTSQSSQNSSESAASANVPNALSELESHMRLSGDDADDEKSVLTEYGSLISRQKLATRSAQIPCMDRLGNTNLSTSAVTVADSSTTTCSDTSNTSSSSLGTTSSDTSASSGDIYDESFFAKRAAAAAAAKTVAPTKLKGSGPLKLFKIAKPNLIGSFMKKKKLQTPASPKLEQANLSTDNQCNQSSPEGTITTENKQTGTNAQKLEIHNADKTNTISSTSEKQKVVQKAPPQDHLSIDTTQSASNKLIDESELQIYEQLQKQILSEEEQLKEECHKLNFANYEIELLEAQIHKFRAQTHGKNYVQDTYLSGCENDHIKSQKTDKKLPRLPSMSEPIQWISDCDDASMLEDYLQMSERVINAQMSIEENKRRAEILLQEVQDEIWRLSNDPQMPPQTKRVTALALGLEPPEFDEISDDEDISNSFEPLSVSAGKYHTESFAKRLSRRKSNSELDELEVTRTRMELEANLSLSLRLASEVDEVEKMVCNARHLLQSKGETMLDLVRELAQSPEGIPAELWDEFGELLMAYDAEIAVKRYLAACANSDNANSTQVQRKAINHEMITVSPMLSEEDVIHPASFADKQLHHSVSPKASTELREHDLKLSDSINKSSRSTDKPHFVFPPSLSTPAASQSRSRHSSLTSPLLPMLPVPDFNDSDYEKTPSETVDANNSVASTMISTENAVPVVLRHNKSCPANLRSLADQLQERNRVFSSRDSSSTIDDSGNASGGSTNSDCASTDSGSRNGSCDGGSRPSSEIIENQDSAYSSPLFLRDNLKQTDNQLRFTYPPILKPLTAKEKLSKLGDIKPTKELSTKPPVPLKSPTVKLVSTMFADENKRRSLILHNENRQKKLIRRNSAQPERSSGPDQFFRRVSSFGKSGISPPLDLWKQSQNPAKPLIRSKEQYVFTQKKDAAMNPNNVKTRCHKHITALNPSSLVKPNPRQVLKTNAVKNRDNLQKVNISSADGNNKLPYSRSSTSTYENDSDTGLSSLHSTDSFDRLNVTSGETLV